MNFDKDAFMSLVEGDRELATTLLELFVRDWPDIFAQLESALAEGRASDVEKLAHRIKGTVRNFFAEEAGKVASHLEYSGRDQKLDGLAPYLAQLKTHLELLQRDLDAFLKGL